MTQAEIVARIDAIRKELENDSGPLLRACIQRRDYHWEKSGRNRLAAFLIGRLRRRLIVEVDHILKPVLDNQKEINLRLLREIENLKRLHEPAQTGAAPDPAATETAARAPAE